MESFISNFIFFISSTYIIWIRDFLDIGLVSYVIYRTLLLIKGTRAVQIIKGIFVLFAFYLLVNYVLQLRTMAWIMQNGATLVILAIPIVFQPELRRLLAHIGEDRVLVETLFTKGKDLFDFINIMVLSVKNLSNKKTGALIIIERSTGLNEFIETGIKVDSSLSPEVIETIFYSGTPLHDGAVVIRDNRIIAASVLLPLSENIKPVSGKHNLGTRHRAGLGLAETSDAICIIVSEETGDISIAMKGKLFRHLTEEGLEKFLLDTYQNKKKNTMTLNSRIFKSDDKVFANNENIQEKKKNTISEYFKNNNWYLRLVAIIASIILVILLGRTTVNDINHEKTFILPIEPKYKDINNINKIKLKIEPSFVRIRLNGTKQDLDHIKMEDLNVFVNIDKIENTQRLPVILSIPTDVTIKEVNPKDVLIKVYNK
ncbi:MAG: TIGR00159 family protein [Candidatus Sericytochromatia bacterium]|nr:TIGR00159 family protein [Candidatus Sericytochromatia bacterium]